MYNYMNLNTNIQEHSFHFCKNINTQEYIYIIEKMAFTLENIVILGNLDEVGFFLIKNNNLNLNKKQIK